MSDRDVVSGQATPPSRVHDTAPAPMARSRDLAERSIKDRRRSRDRRAERAAFVAIFIIFVAIGGAGWTLLNSEWFAAVTAEPEVPVDPAVVAEAKAAAAAAAKAQDRRRTTSSVLDETPDLPALRMMSTDGLTIAAEGLPEVAAEEMTAPASLLAAVETCRFAYGVWEFSPNKRFRFLSTCGAFEGQILVGAYEVQGSRVKMSALVDGAVAIISEFEVEKPSRMMTLVAINGEKVTKLSVNQKITTLRAGLEGESFRSTYASRNTLEPPGTRPAPTPEAPTSGKPDPLLEMMGAPR